MPVTLADSLTGSSLLQAALAAEAPALGVDLPSAKAFKDRYAEVLPDFEAARVAHPDRVAIAGRLASALRQALRWEGQPLHAALRPAAAPALRAQVGHQPAGWTPEITYRGRVYRGSELAELVPKLEADFQISPLAAARLRSLAPRLERPIDLRGQTFAVLGGGAELAPSAHLLAAGARVLWVDRRAPELRPEQHAGELVPLALDLLQEPDRVLGALLAEAGPVHLGLYAYAPGGGRELLLTGVLNAIAEAARPASVTVLVSPTTPVELPPEEAVGRQQRRAAAPLWQRLLRPALREPAVARRGAREVGRSIVPLQGATYQAAQYLGKRMTAEAWLAEQTFPLSVQVAGISRTRSLGHPAFLAAFAAAPRFGIEIWPPETTRTLAALLMLAEREAPRPAATPEGAQRLHGVAVHGGVWSDPWVFGDTVRTAAVVGMLRHPGLLLRRR